MDRIIDSKKNFMHFSDFFFFFFILPIALKKSPDSTYFTIYLHYDMSTLLCTYSTNDVFIPLNVSTTFSLKYCTKKRTINQTNLNQFYLFNTYDLIHNFFLMNNFVLLFINE